MLALEVLLYAWVWRGMRADDREWERQRARLSRPRSPMSPINYTQLHTDAYVFAPGAQWIVSDPAQVQVLCAGR